MSTPPCLHPVNPLKVLCSCLVRAIGSIRFVHAHERVWGWPVGLQGTFDVSPCFARRWCGGGGPWFDFVYPIIIWPLPDIRLFIRGLCSSQFYSRHSTYPLLHPPPFVFCNQYCAVYGFPPPPLFCHSTYNIGHSNIVWRPNNYRNDEPLPRTYKIEFRIELCAAGHLWRILVFVSSGDAAGGLIGLGSRGRALGVGGA